MPLTLIVVLPAHQVPSILSEELRYNPFMMTNDPSLKDALGLPGNTQPAQVLAELRKQKNQYQQSDI